jgi:phosphoenolpyruvate synthase/pyruvate phosphate dikinase
MSAPSRLLEHLGDAALDEARVGHKAGRLHRLVQAGARVPPGFVVAFDVELGAVDDAALAAAVERVGGFPVAVRSSGLPEDRADASVAGQYET